MTTANITIDDVQDLIALYPQTYFSQTPDGFKQWADWLRRQKMIKMVDVIALEIWFKDGKILFQGKTYEQVRP